MESFAQVLEDPRISEVVIVDDASQGDYFRSLSSATSGMGKVRLIRNKKNMGMSLNKARAVTACRNPWVILFDSDNRITPAYLDALDKIPLDPEVIYLPVDAHPRFNYQNYAGWLIDKKKAPAIAGMRLFDCLMNTGNYLVHRDSYCKVYRPNPQVRGSDCIWMNYLWLASGRKLLVVPGLRYAHRVHANSGWMEHAEYNIQSGNKIMDLIKALK